MGRRSAGTIPLFSTGDELPQIERTDLPGTEPAVGPHAARCRLSASLRESAPREICNN